MNPTTIVKSRSAANPEQSAASCDATVGAESLMGFCELVSDLGGDPVELLRHAAIDPAILRQTGVKVTLQAATNLLEDSARRLGRADFGLRLAERQSPLAIPKPIDLLISNAPTVGEAMRCCTRHIQSYTSGLRVQLTRDDRRRLYLFNIEFACNEFTSRRQITEQLLLLTVSANLALSGDLARAQEVWFSHPRVGPASSYAKRFGIPVKFGQPLDGVFYSEADLNCKVINRDARIFESECQKQYPAEQPSMVSDVYQAIVRTLADICCTRDQVSALLGVHPRTLQRRLFSSGISFEELRDGVRRKLAARYLARKDLSLIEIVNRLGYSEPAVLSRSCRRWFAATPTQVRRALACQEQALTEPGFVLPERIPGAQQRSVEPATASAVRRRREQFLAPRLRSRQRGRGRQRPLGRSGDAE